MRRKARIDDKLEKLAVSDGLRAVRFAEVVVVLLDATIPFEKQDLTIIDLIESEGRAVVIGLNKWDLVGGPARPAEEATGGLHPPATAGARCLRGSVVGVGR